MFAGCIIRDSDPQTGFILVVYCAVHLSGGQRQEQVMDAEAFPWRIRSPVTGLFSEAHFASDLTGREKAQALRRNQRSHLLTRNHSLNIAVDIEVENHDGQAIFLAK
jgi:hypothetical protein